MFEWFGSDVWDEARATVTAIGALVALAVAGRTYALNSRSKREEQARLVYSQVVSLEGRQKGSVAGFPDDEGPLFAATNGDVWQVSGPLLDRAVLAVVEVHNKSKEVVGPVGVRLASPEEEWPGSPGFTLQALHPDSTARVYLLGRNELPFGTPVLLPSLMFRDSAGTWWKRKGTDPISRLRQDPRLAVAYFSPSGDNTFVLFGDGFQQTYISSAPLRWFFGAAARIPGVRGIVARLRLRERAENRALRKLVRASDDWLDEPSPSPARAE